MTDIAPPSVPDDPLTTPFWDGARKGELRIQRCRECGTYIHLPRPVCRNCRSFDLSWEAVSGRATLYSFTVTRRAFHPYFAQHVPYPLGTVELAEQGGLHLISRLVDAEPGDLAIDMDLEVRFDDLGNGVVLPVFAPAGAVS